MKNIDFDQINNRIGSNSLKWDGYESRYPGLDAKGCLPMWVADSDFKAPKEVIDALIEVAKFGVYGYPKGASQAFNKSIINWIEKRHEWSIEEKWIVPTEGIVAAIAYTIQAFTEEGDQVIIQPPVYYPFKDVVDKNNRHLVLNPLVYDGGKYTIDFEDFESKVSNPKCKLFLLCNPHNPVGRAWNEEELKRLTDICIKHNVLIFSDEIHSDLIYKGYIHIPTGKINTEIHSHLISAFAPTKTFNLAGIKGSAIIIPDEKVRKKYKKQLVKNGATGLSIFGYASVVASYEHGEHYLNELLEYVKGNVDYFTEYIEKNLPEIKVVEAEGTYLLWVDFNGTGLSPNEIDKTMIEKAKVAVDLGRWFGEEGAGFLRFNLACPRATVVKALEQIKDAFPNLR